MKNTLPLLTACLCLLTGCNRTAQKKPGELATIRVKEAMQNPVGLTLSDLGKKAAYIALETNDSSVVDVSSVTAMAVSDQAIIVGSRKSTPIKVFDKATGRYIRQIGRIGNGPGEYPNGKNFQIDPKTQKIYVPVAADRYQCYDMQGGYLGQVSWKGLPAGMIVNSYFLEDSIYSYVNIPTTHSTALSYKYDRKTGEKKDSLPFRWGNNLPAAGFKTVIPIDGAEMVGGTVFLAQDTHDNWTYGHRTNPPFWYLHDRLHVKDVFCDTVYTIDAFDRLTPEIRFDMGAGNRFDRFENSAATTDKFIVTRLLETDDLFYFILMKNMYDFEAWRKGRYTPPVCGIYNKHTGVTKIMKSAYIKHDRQHFPDFIVYNVSTAGEFVVCYQAAHLVEARENIPESKQPDWMKQLKEDDNPVILLIK